MTSLEYDLIDEKWSEHLERFSKFKYRACIVGCHGSGKTTYLKSFERKLKTVGINSVRVFLNDESPRIFRAISRKELKKILVDSVLIIDGAEFISIFEWLTLSRLIRKGRGALISSHHPLKYPVLHNCRTTPESLNRLLTKLSPPKINSRIDINNCYDRHSGNLREVFFELYDKLAG
ncbi:MAG: hypothetical protein KDD53_07060 [Bdellovibrionales bacterium]|nr:hypothetical protein [Bdellovibrionales bacterium]